MPKAACAKSSLCRLLFLMGKAMLRLMCELNEGRRSGEEEGYVSVAEVRAYFREKKA